jgi:hypothetical protein
VAVLESGLRDWGLGNRKGGFIENGEWSIGINCSAVEKLDTSRIEYYQTMEAKMARKYRTFNAD